MHPPRMPGWQKPFRGLFRWLRGHRVAPRKLSGGGRGRASSFATRTFDRIASDNATGLLLSVIPGLAHLIKGRFREVRLFVALWGICLASGLFLYGCGVGFLLIGLAIGLHAWIGLQYGLFREITEFFARVGTTLVIVAVLTILYWTAPRVAAYGLATGRTPLTIPAMNVQQGDLLLVRRLAVDSGSALPRGALVRFHPQGFRNTLYSRWATPSEATIGQIVGLPGETIQIRDGVFVVGGHRLDPNEFPVPRWLQRDPIRSQISIPSARYFVSTEYTVTGHGHLRLDDGMIKNACVIPASEIRGQAFMLWWPLWRRGWIE